MTMKKVSDTILLARRDMNLTQMELATKAGVSISTLRNIEAGKAASFETIALIYKALGLKSIEI